jgi:hypothetical protein
LFNGRLSLRVGAESGAPAEDKAAVAGAAGVLPLSQSQVHGQVLIGGTKQLEINAAPSP